MNTEALQDQLPTTIGRRLRQARENMGLSQQAVAERLCLKVSTVQDIEGDQVNSNLVSTFLRGYIRSYARLVHISEEELTPLMAQQAPIKASKVALIQSFSLGKTHKKCDGWLMGFTWLILFVVIGITGAWWWQNHQVQQQDITNMTNQASVQLSRKDSITSAPLDNNTANTWLLPTNQPIVASTGAVVSSLPASASAIHDIPEQKTSNISPTTAISSPFMPQSATTTTPLKIVKTGASDIDGNVLMVKFTDDCWLEVFDAGGKRLFSGIHHNGAKLNLIGQAPYKLKIGAPAAVQIYYQGKPVDLSQFIRSNQIARLTIADQ